MSVFQHGAVVWNGCPICLRAKVRELEESVNYLGLAVSASNVDRDRYREALERIVNGIATHTTPADCRSIARAALEVKP